MTTILDLGAAEFTVGLCGEEEKKPVGSVTRVAGPSGPAVRFDFVDWSQGGAFTTPVAAGPAWDEADGISFWVKGDGSKDCAALGFADAADEQAAYEAWFSIESTEWRQVTVPWGEFMPVTPRGEFLDPKGESRPSRLTTLRVGKFVWRRGCPPFSFSLADMRLEPEIALDTTDYTPAQAGTPRFLEKLQAKQPISIVTIGDSLTDPRHWANVEVSWRGLLAKKIKEVYGCEVTLLHASMGGAFLPQSLSQVPFWLPQAPEPDLITIWFGANEFWNDVTPEHFRDNFRRAVDYLRRLTKGRSELLLFTSFRLRDQGEAIADLAQVVREVAAEKRTGLVEVHDDFKDWASRPDLVPWLYAWDGHLAAMGHALVAKTAWEAITQP